MENTEHTKNPSSVDLYHLDFGKHKGKLLDKVPSDYIDWLIRNEVHTSRPALATALRALGKLDASDAAHQDTKLKAPSAHQDTKCKAPSANRDAKLKAPSAHQETKWKAPSVTQAKERCFFDPFLGDPLWISDKDAATYFNLRDSALASAGVHLVSSIELDMFAQIGGSMFTQAGGRRRWLYQVFACAEHFKTASPGTARQALQRFLGKNKRREDEIMVGMGLG